MAQMVTVDPESKTPAPEPYPKLVANRAGETRTVENWLEQDQATREGFLRSLGRRLEAR